MCQEIIYLIYVYKKDLALNNLKLLMCHKTKLNQTDKIKLRRQETRYFKFHGL